MSELHPDLSTIATVFAEKINEYDGHNSEWRVHSRVGETRRDAMGSGGADAVLDLADGDLQQQIVEFAIDRIKVHSEGPAGYLWLALRRVGLAGNVLTSPPVRCGGEDAHATLTSTRSDSIAALANMAPRALELMERITVRSIGYAENARKDELDAKIAMAQLIGAAEAGDENARWQAMSEAAGSLAPVLSQAVAAWRDSVAGGGVVSTPHTAEEAVSAFNSWPEEAKAALVAALKEHFKGSQDTPEGGKDGEQ